MIIPSNEDNKKEDYTSEKVIFLDGTNSDDFVSILSNVTGIDNIEETIMGDSISYENYTIDDNYSIEVDANKDSKQIDYARVICLSDVDATNVFMAFNRMNYVGENDAELTNWLVENIGKEANIKIGNANFTLSLSTSNHPILEMKTDGSDAYQKEQYDKILNSTKK